MADLLPKPCRPNGLEEGDILTWGGDPRRWRVVKVEVSQGIAAFKIVPIDTEDESPPCVTRES